MLHIRNARTMLVLSTGDTALGPTIILKFTNLQEEDNLSII